MKNSILLIIATALITILIGIISTTFIAVAIEASKRQVEIHHKIQTEWHQTIYSAYKSPIGYVTVSATEINGFSKIVLEIWAMVGNRIVCDYDSVEFSIDFSTTETFPRVATDRCSILLVSDALAKRFEAGQMLVVIASGVTGYISLEGFSL